MSCIKRHCWPKAARLATIRDVLGSLQAQPKRKTSCPITPSNSSASKGKASRTLWQFHWRQMGSAGRRASILPITARSMASAGRGREIDARDVEAALDAAHKAKDAWARISPAERSLLLNKVADRMEENLELLALAETLDNGKPIRETRGADVRWRSIISGISPVASGPRKAQFRRSTTIRSPTISRSRWASSARSFHGIFRC